MLSFSRTFQTFVAAIILCVMFESPLHGIEKILMKSTGKKILNMFSLLYVIILNAIYFLVKKKNNEEVVEDDVKSFFFCFL